MQQHPGLKIQCGLKGPGRIKLGVKRNPSTDMQRGACSKLIRTEGCKAIGKYRQEPI